MIFSTTLVRIRDVFHDRLHPGSHEEAIRRFGYPINPVRWSA